MSDKHAHVRQIGFDEIIPTLPIVEPWDELINRPIDIFITALGFEDRAVAIPKAIACCLSGSATSRHALGVVCCYGTNSQDNEHNRELISTALATFCGNQVDVDADSPQEIEKFLGDQIMRLVEVRAPVEVVFDISASSGNLILSVMHTLLRYRNSVSLRLLYSEPACYFPKREEYDIDPEALVLRACDTGNADSPQEYGVEDVQINELYPGMDGENRPEFVIAVPALRTGRLVRCLQHLSDQPLSAPDKYVFWILSEPPASDLKWRQELQRRVVKNTLSSIVGFSVNDPLAPQLRTENYTTCSTRDYRSILRRVVEEADRKLGYNLSIVHMGSKLQAIGISLALNVRDEITACFARPIQYNPSRYSEGLGPMWQLDMPDLAGVVERLGQVGLLTFTAKIETERTGLPSM